MALTKLTKDMGIISALDDEPNDIGGLSATNLKAKFDEGNTAVKDYINDTLTAEIEGVFSTKAEVQDVVLGQIPDGSLAQTKLENTLSAKIDSAVQPSQLADDIIPVSPDVATALDLTGNPQVKDALAKLKTLVDTAQTTANGRAKFATGSYVGINAYDSANPCSLIFDFVPHGLLVIAQRDTTGGYVAMIWADHLISSAYGIAGYSFDTGSATFSGYGLKAKISEDRKTIYWYNEQSSVRQLNGTNATYDYCIAG